MIFVGLLAWTILVVFYVAPYVARWRAVRPNDVGKPVHTAEKNCFGG